MAGPSQPQVTNEVWDDDRVKSFLEMEAYDGNVGFHLLMRAYRGMRPADFERFLPFFVDAKHDLEATNDQGQTLWTIIEEHRQGADFIALRKKYA
jgi:hypothetical protein